MAWSGRRRTNRRRRSAARSMKLPTRATTPHHLKNGRQSANRLRTSRQRNQRHHAARRVSLHRQRPGGLRGVRRREHRSERIFSERFVTSPVSPLGQRTYVRTKFATAVALAEHADQRSASACACRRTKSSRSIRCTATPSSPISRKGSSSSNLARSSTAIRRTTSSDGRSSRREGSDRRSFNPDGKTDRRRLRRLRRTPRLYHARRAVSRWSM